MYYQTLIVSQTVGSLPKSFSSASRPKMGQAESAEQIAFQTDRSALIRLSERYHQFVPFHRTSRSSSCPAAPNECRTFATLYIKSDGSQAALGFIDSKKQFQPTTSDMSFARLNEYDWYLVGADVSDNHTIVIKYKNGEYIHKIREVGLDTKLHVH
jgi:hypothetical protein